GHDVLALNQSRQLMETIEAYEPDVIILDVMMPERNGYELTRELKASANWRHIPIVLLTALAEQEACIKGLEAGAEDFVTKPFNRRELCARVSNLIKLKRFGDFLQQNIRALEAYDAQTGLPKPALLKELAMPLLARQDAAPVHFILCKAQLSKSLIHTLTQGEFTLEERQIYRAIVERINKTMPLGAPGRPAHGTGHASARQAGCRAGSFHPVQGPAFELAHPPPRPGRIHPGRTPDLPGHRRTDQQDHAPGRRHGQPR